MKNEEKRKYKTKKKRKVLKPLFLTLSSLLAVFALAFCGIYLKIRNSIDFDAEATIARTNSKLLAGLETIILPSCGEHIHISSTVVRDITINGGDPSDLLPENIEIKQYLNND